MASNARTLVLVLALLRKDLGVDGTNNVLQWLIRMAGPGPAFLGWLSFRRRPYIDEKIKHVDLTSKVRAGCCTAEQTVVELSVPVARRGLDNGHPTAAVGPSRTAGCEGIERESGQGPAEAQGQRSVETVRPERSVSLIES